MPSLVERGNIVYASMNIQIPLTKKLKAQELGVNLTQAAIAGIDIEIEKRTKKE